MPEQLPAVDSHVRQLAAQAAHAIGELEAAQRRAQAALKELRTAAAGTMLGAGLLTRVRQLYFPIHLLADDAQSLVVHDPSEPGSSLLKIFGRRADAPAALATAETLDR